MEQKDIKVKKEWFIEKGVGSIYDSYKIDERMELGQGSYGKVIKAKNKHTNAVRAIKIIPKAKVKNHERFATEINIQKTLDHPNIIKLYETYEDERNVYLVFEVCEGGELFDRIISKGHFSENEARHLFVQIMKSLFYCHKHGICHRDLKPENFLFGSKDDHSVLKLIDFGLSKIFANENEIIDSKPSNSKIAGFSEFRGRRKPNAMTTKAGTPYYIAPEVMDGNYDEKCDIWSAGVLLYILLCGYPPFYGNTDAQIQESVKKGKYDFESSEWKGVNDGAKDLIKKCLVLAQHRPTAEQVLGHPWMQQEVKDKRPLNLSFDKLKAYTDQSKFKQAVMQYIASQMSEKEIGGLIDIFNKLDTNGDGEISIEEFRSGLQTLNGKAAEEVQGVFDKLDADKNGSINYTEFIAATMSQNMYLKEEKIYQAFKMFDKDGNGRITPSEIKGVLGNDDNFKDIEPGYWEDLIKEVDLNGDGVIDYNEFITLMKKL